MVDIPIRNVWLLQFLASDLNASGRAPTGAENAPDDLPELIARMLADEVTARIHTGLSVGFRRTTEDLRRVRGRIDLLATQSHRLLDRGQVRCSFDQIVVDTPANRLVRAALERAALLVRDPSRYRSLALQFSRAGVVGPCPSLSLVPDMLRQRLLVRDHFMISAAELLLAFAIPTQESGGRTLPLPSLEARYLRWLFENAAFGFYLRHLCPQGWTVRHGEQQKWDTDSISDGMPSVLPGMQTDVTLSHPNPNGLGPRRVIIDTKFTSVLRADRYGAEKLKSGYVYQIYAYVMSQRDRPGSVPAEGLMLHPVTGGSFDEEVVIQGRRFRFATVDLMARSPEIVRQFLVAVEPTAVAVE